MGSQCDDDNNGGRRETRWCAVTGGRGFMARHLVAALLRSGEWRVRVTDLTPTLVLGPGETEEIFGNALRDGRAVYASADVCNLEQLIKVFEGVDVVFHTAAADPSKNNLQLHYKVNVIGTKNVIGACKICKVKRLIHTSSSAVVFDGVHGLFNVNESLPYPDKFPDAYAQTKAEAEKLVMDANDTNDLLTCCIRPGSIFGPGDLVMPTLDRYGRTHAYFITNMEPMNMWDFLYTVQEELGYKRLFKIRIPIHVIKPISYLVEGAYKVLYHFGMPTPQILTQARIKYATLNRTFSCDKAVKELGYKPIVKLMDGVKITVKLYIQLRNKDL
ncbi:hypothetical protein BDA96_01G366900 [Sorghum bicolor]|uniref:3-beta hydroxysteroid dehydrogenase/isomerase domain-containing protein n=2 Tax=Sorghum bicolor TaxID=4558 RepID=A0A921UZS7_SORBI|nr:hypothetical protein BDA96_01G366900 [Sorghum bicolor]